jgi:hypothetical protein
VNVRQHAYGRPIPRAVEGALGSRIAAWLPPAAPKDVIIAASIGVVVYIGRGLLLTVFAWVGAAIPSHMEVAGRLARSALRLWLERRREPRGGGVPTRA